MKAALEHDGALVTVCERAVEVFEVLRSMRPDVLVSDIAMPGESGIELIRQIRALPAEQGGRVPAIAVTAFTLAFQRSEVLAEGFQEWLSKPLDVWELSRLVAKVTGVTR